MFFSKIIEGDSVEIALQTGTTKRCYFSAVVSIQNGQKIFAISRPQDDKQNFLSLNDNGTVYEVIIGSNNTALACECSVVKAFHVENGVSCVLLRAVSSVIKLHRRKHTRHECSLPIRFAPINDGEDFMSNAGTWYNGNTKDISSGGIKLVSDLEVAVGTMIKLIVESDNYLLIAECRVLNQSKIMPPQKSEDQHEDETEEKDEKSVPIDDSDVGKTELNAVFTAVIREDYYRNKILAGLKSPQA